MDLDVIFYTIGRPAATDEPQMKGMKEEAMEAAAAIALAFSLVNSLLGLGRVSRRHAR